MAITGKISQIIGPVVDVSFEGVATSLPPILDAMYVTKSNGQRVVLECQQHLGEDRVRTIAMDSTDGLQRGQEVVLMGTPITMPTGDEIKGRLFNVVGEAIDGLGEVNTKGISIHRSAPKFEDLLLPRKCFLPVLKLLTCWPLM